MYLFGELKKRLLLAFLTWLIIVFGGLYIFNNYSIVEVFSDFKEFLQMPANGEVVMFIITLIATIASYISIFFIGLFTEIFLNTLKSIILIEE